MFLPQIIDYRGIPVPDLGRSRRHWVLDSCQMRFLRTVHIEWLCRSEVCSRCPSRSDVLLWHRLSRNCLMFCDLPRLTHKESICHRESGCRVTGCTPHSSARWWPRQRLKTAWIRAFRLTLWGTLALITEQRLDCPQLLGWVRCCRCLNYNVHIAILTPISQAGVVTNYSSLTWPADVIDSLRCAW